MTMPVPTGAVSGRTCEGFYAYLQKIGSRATPILANTAPQSQQGATPGTTPAPALLGPPTPPPTADELATMRLIQIHVLGHYPDGSIDIFCEANRTVHHIKSIANFFYPNLLEMVGVPARDFVHQGREAIPGRKTMEEVRNSIALLAGQVSLADVSPIGQGVWWADGKIALVNSGHAAVLNNGKLEPVRVPKIGTQILDFQASDPWVDFGQLQKYMDDAQKPGWSMTVFQEMVSLLSKWYWKHPVDSTLTASLIAASWVQTLWPWRPEVTVTGSSDSGKSSLLDDLMRRLYGKMVAWINKPTEAAIRQKVGNRASIIIVDEFEDDAKRAAVLELFRSSSRGGEIFRGSADQKGRKFIIRHLPWMGNIESGLNDEADRNRVISLELTKPPKGLRGTLRVPDDAVLQDLGFRLLAVALTNVQTAIGFFTSLKSSQIDGVPGRLVENYSVPASLLAAIRGDNLVGARAVLESFLHGKNFSRQGQGDEQELMRTILESHFEVGPARRMSVAEVLADEACFEERREALERNGVALVSTNSGPRRYVRGPNARIFLNPSTIKRYLIRNTTWSLKDIGQLIERIPGAEHKEKVIAGKRVQGWSLPAEDWIIEREDVSQDAIFKSLQDSIAELPAVGDPSPVPGMEDV